MAAFFKKVDESNELQEFSENIKTIKEIQSELKEIQSELTIMEQKVNKVEEFINKYSSYMESYVRTQMLNMQNFDSDTEHTIVKDKNYENSYHNIDTLKDGYENLKDAIISFVSQIISAFEEEEKTRYMLINRISSFFCDPEKDINNLSFQRLLDSVVSENNRSKALPNEKSLVLEDKFEDVKVLSKKIYASKELDIEYKWPEEEKGSLIIFPALYSNKQTVANAKKIK